MSKTHLLSLIIISLLGLLLLVASLPASAGGAGGSITICTVKLPNGILRQCTPTPGVVQAQHYRATSTPKQHSTTITVTPVITPTISYGRCFRLDPQQGIVPCPQNHFKPTE